MRKDLFIIKAQPKASSIKGRSSTLNAEFIKSKVPYVPATDIELKKRYFLFFPSKSEKDEALCFYCEAPQTEWDHLLSPLKKKKNLSPGEEQTSGYFHEINNLIPSCHSCNSSKGNTPYMDWMRSSSKTAKHNLIRKLIRSGISEDEAKKKIEEKVNLIESVLSKHPPRLVKFEELMKGNVDIINKERELKELQDKITETCKEATDVAQILSKFYSDILTGLK